MKVLLVTPLYPPETGGAAPYIKELARRLSAKYEVVVVAYAHLPENVPGVQVAAIDKRAVLPVRLFHFFTVLWRLADSGTLAYAENGTSVEVPLLIVTLLRRLPVIFHSGDARARARARGSFWRGSIERLMRRRAQATVEETPLKRPEILPFNPYPSEAFAAYEDSWKKHVQRLENLFNHV